MAATRAKVISSVKQTPDDARIDMPYETSVRLLHDQTEATDGDRTRQHEGWPAPKEGDTEPRWKAEVRERSAQAESGSETDDPASSENGRT